MLTMTGSSVTFPLNKEWFYKCDLQSPNAIQWIFQVYFSEDSLGLYRIELIVVASSDATSFRKPLRKSIKSMFYLVTNHIVQYWILSRLLSVLGYYCVVPISVKAENQRWRHAIMVTKTVYRHVRACVCVVNRFINLISVSLIFAY